ncbi:MAG: L-histidine N(alpha)-methyltransferase [Rhodospirillales bacterium]|nr:L-histidine N(alpha)-methyltransferase [Rhodospirillales bacterium]MBN8905081.1 L-histidine N(alpha)-methyltransferase [Rhodospirillales bacterium]
MPNDSWPARAAVDPVVTRLALEGLRAAPKTLPPQLFYDDEGCRLFYAITALPEYYLTRTEWALLQEVAPKAGEWLRPGGTLIEYGASHEAKASLLLGAETNGRPVFDAYVAIDVAATALRAMGARLRKSFPALRFTPIEADFEQPIVLPADLPTGPRLGFFPGSTIGNLDPQGARRFLARARTTLGADALFLLGADLRKSPQVLVPAYDDAAGVTAAFNRNLLVRLNREADAEFDPKSFDHRAVWNAQEGRIEMHLVSRRAQTVRLGSTRIAFAAGESIHTENSYKFTREDIAAMASASGWQMRETWTDSEDRFGLFLLGAS